MSTSFTKLLGVRYPIVSAAMAGAAGGKLAGEVSKAGGLGFVAWTAAQGPSGFKEQLSLARSLSSEPIGAGFLCWALDLPSNEGSACIDLALNARVSAVWLFGGDYGRWAGEVRRKEEALGRESRKDRVKIFVQVGSLDEAERAVEMGLLDVLIVQGSEAGGHGLIASTPLATLLPHVLSHLRPSFSGPVLAAGGLTLPAHVAAALALGADGIVAGTRFLLSPESIYSEDKKERIRSAPVGGTERSETWDRASVVWPDGFDGRGLSNSTSRLSPSEAGDPAFRDKYAAAVKEGDLNVGVVWAGAGAGIVRELKPAGEIVRELSEGLQEGLKA